MNDPVVILMVAPPFCGGEAVAAAARSYFGASDPPATIYNALKTHLDDGGIDATRMLARTRFDPDPGSVISLRKQLLALGQAHMPLILHDAGLPFLLPLWRAVFDGSAIRGTTIALSANPLLTAEAAVSELGETQSFGIALWSQAMLRITEDAGDALVLSYDRFLREPEHVLSGLAERIDGLAPDAATTPESLRAKIDGIILPRRVDLAHTARDVATSETVPDFVKTLFDRLEQDAREKRVLSSDGPQTPLAKDGTLSFMFEAMSGVSERNAALGDQLSTLTDQLETLMRARDELETALSRAEEDRGRIETEREAMRIRITDLEADVENARSSNNEQIGILAEKNDILTQTIRENEKTIASLQTLVEENRAAFEQRERELALENARLAERAEAASLRIKDLQKERKQDQQRFNVERASLIKEQRRRDEEFKTLLDKLSIDPRPEQPAGADPTSMPALTRQAMERIAALEEQARQSEQAKYAAEAEKRVSEYRAEAAEQAIEDERTRNAEKVRRAEQALLDHEAKIAELTLAADEARTEVRALKSSTSWKVSAPIRGARKAARNPRAAVRKVVPQRARAMVRSGLYRTIPFLFTGTVAYKNWKAAREEAAGRQPDAESPHPRDTEPTPSSLPTSPESVEANRVVAERLAAPVPLRAQTPPAATKARAVAFYLPQFHQIPENDLWWGQGFTEWTNVRPAKPQFNDHYQPHVPGELGYYDLARDPHIMRRQAELAKLHGIEGFAYYFYWFGGKRLLETPLERMLEDKGVDIPFCLCWANENWSRRWDGEAHEILIAQDHSPEDDIALIEHLSRYIRDPRYIRVDGKPLILIYRPGILPNAKETAERWRRWCRKNDIGEIYLAYTQSFEKVPPSLMGFDAAIEFPPNNHGLVGDPSLIPPGAADFKGKVFDWRDLIKRSRNYPSTSYTLFRGVNPSWDNTARRKNHGTVLLNSDPALFHEWLENAIEDTQARITNPNERLIFINAWNEWAEGAHLEPDEKFGYAWLEACRLALSREPLMDDARASDIHGSMGELDDDIAEVLPAAPASINGSGRNLTADSDAPTLPTDRRPRKILVVTHDLFRHGAQMLSLGFARTLKETYGFEVHTISSLDGPLRGQFERFGQVTILSREAPVRDILNSLKALRHSGFIHAFVNSSASGWLAPHLGNVGIAFIGLVHELDSIVSSMGLEEGLEALNTHASAVVFPSTIVADRTANALSSGLWERAKTLSQGVYKPAALIFPEDKDMARRAILREHKLAENATLFLGAGFADHRKGIDLFIDWALAACAKATDQNPVFIWIGEIALDMKDSVEEKLAAAGEHRDRIVLPGFVNNTRDYYLAADIYTLTSREDPFPSTALEALDAGTPVVMIRDTGGIEDLADHPFVVAAADQSPKAFLDAARPWLDNDELRRHAGLMGVGYIRAHHGFKSYVGELLNTLNIGELRAVTAIIPGYNYEGFIEQRLRSVIDQSYPPREIIYLDDASSDDSLNLARRILADCGINYRIIANTENSGNVFHQWRRGVGLARSPLTWIAEADDAADPEFLATMVQKFTDPEVIMAFCESRQIDETGKVIAPNYQYYVRDVSEDRWTQSYVIDGQSEIREGLSIKNTIPNVSGVLFRTGAIRNFFDQNPDFGPQFRTAGDWYIYVNLLRSGKIAFDETPLNYHRRHSNSVTISKFDLDDLREIAGMQSYIAREVLHDDASDGRARRYLDHLVQEFDLIEKYDQSHVADAMDADLDDVKPSAEERT